MTKHYMAISIDSDPDGLSMPEVDRNNLVWDGLEFAIENFHQALPDIPLTWYVRADGQLEHAYGTVMHALNNYHDFWKQALQRGDDLGWHPHLYTVPQGDDQPDIILDSEMAVAELTRIWQSIKDSDLPLTSFRMGEAWHTPQTLNLIEELGFTVDSTAIPNRDDSANGHPRNWTGAPNQPYYPDKTLPRKAGHKRSLIEVPMTSWYFQAPYDSAPKLRYINPCIHPDMWQQALDRLQKSFTPDQSTYAWVMILHPTEAMPQPKPDMLYAYSLEVMQHNIKTFQDAILALGGEVIPTTVSKIGDIWRQL